MPTFYAAPNASGDGLLAGSPGSLGAVKALARVATGDVTVNLRGGTYDLLSPLELNEQDSGDGGVITWAAQPGERPVFSGGMRVPGWSLHDAALGIYRAAVPIGTASRQLYVNGVRARRVRRAASAFSRIADGASPVYECSDASLPALARPSDIEFVYTGRVRPWVEPRLRVASAARSGSVTTFEMGSDHECANRTYFGVEWPAPTWLENAYEFLSPSTPGQFYLDSTAGWVYYVPRVGESMFLPDVRLPVLESLITSSAPLANVVFDGITFEHATWLGPDREGGFFEGQANIEFFAPSGWSASMGGAVHLSGAQQSVKITRCAFRHLGGVGVVLGEGTKDSEVSRSVFTDISGTAIRLAGFVDLSPALARQTSRNIICNNFITSSALEYQGGVGIHVGFTDGTRVLHNDVLAMPYTGISLGWTWGRTGYAHGNEIAYNHVREPITVLNDGGGIYVLGAQGGALGSGARSTLHDNVVHQSRADIYSDTGSQMFMPPLYLDNGSTGWDSFNNVSYGAFSLWAFVASDAGENNCWNNYARASAVGTLGKDYQPEWDDERYATEPGYEEWWNAQIIVSRKDPAIPLNSADPLTWPAEAQAIALASGVESLLSAWREGNTLVGFRKPDATVTVACPTATVGTVNYPDSASWNAPLSDLALGDNAVTVSDGTDTLTVTVQGVVVGTTAAVGSVALKGPAGATALGTLALKGPRTSAATGTLSLKGTAHASTPGSVLTVLRRRLRDAATGSLLALKDVATGFELPMLEFPGMRARAEHAEGSIALQGTVSTQAAGSVAVKTSLAVSAAGGIALKGPASAAAQGGSAVAARLSQSAAGSVAVKGPAASSAEGSAVIGYPGAASAVGWVYVNAAGVLEAATLGSVAIQGTVEAGAPGSIAVGGVGIAGSPGSVEVALRGEIGAGGSLVLGIRGLAQGAGSVYVKAPPLASAVGSVIVGTTAPSFIALRTKPLAFGLVTRPAGFGLRTDPLPYGLKTRI